MLTLKMLRDDPKAVIEKLKIKNFDAQPIVDKVLELDARRRSLQTESDALLAQQKQKAAEIGNLMKQGLRDAAEAAKAEVAALKARSAELLAKLEAAVSAWLAGADNIPPILLRKWPSKEKGEKAPKGTKPVACEFRAPLPLAATGLVYAMWSQDGNEKFEPKYRSASLYDGFPVFDGLELFLGESVATGLAERMLSLLLQGSGSLCAASGKTDVQVQDTGNEVRIRLRHRRGEGRTRRPRARRGTHGEDGPDRLISSESAKCCVRRTIACRAEYLV